MPDLKASGPLLAQLARTLEKDEAQRGELVQKIKARRAAGSGGSHAAPPCCASSPCPSRQPAAAAHCSLLTVPAPCLAAPAQGLVMFVIDGQQWTLDLRQGGQGSLVEGPPPEGAKPDLTLTINGAWGCQPGSRLLGGSGWEQGGAGLDGLCR